MRYNLMNKNIIVCTLECGKNGVINNILDIKKETELPIGVNSGQSDILDNLRGWWKNNAIPVERDSIRLGLECLGIESTEELRILGLGLSLNNHYWLCPADENIRWENINFFDNTFEPEVGEALFNHKPLRKINNEVFNSPDASLNGMLKKKWVILPEYPDKRFLVKGGSGSMAQEPFNEVLAGKIFEAAGIKSVAYYLIQDAGNMASICECFNSNSLEFVPAMDLLRQNPKPTYPNISSYDHMKKIYEEYGIADAEQYLDGMIAVDYIIANKDRHYNNFGLLYCREKNTFSPAPMFDSGTSMYCQIATKNIELEDDSFYMRPFADIGPFISAADQMKLVKNFKGIENEKLLQICAGYKYALEKYSDLKQDRIDLLSRGVLIRYNKLVDELERRGITIPESNKRVSDEVMKKGIRFKESDCCFMWNKVFEEKVTDRTKISMKISSADRNEANGIIRE